MSSKSREPASKSIQMLGTLLYSPEPVNDPCAEVVVHDPCTLGQPRWWARERFLLRRSTNRGVAFIAGFGHSVSMPGPLLSATALAQCFLDAGTGR